MKTFEQFLNDHGTNHDEILEGCDCPFNTDKSDSAPGAGESTKEKSEKNKFKGKTRKMDFMKKK